MNEFKEKINKEIMEDLISSITFSSKQFEKSREDNDESMTKSYKKDIIKYAIQLSAVV